MSRIRGREPFNVAEAVRYAFFKKMRSGLLLLKFLFIHVGKYIFRDSLYRS